MPTQESAWLEEVKAYMDACLARRDGPICALVAEHLSSGGKLIRPRLIYKVVELAGGKPADAREWAAAIELLHNATLVHDDYQDGDTHRRGKPTLWVTYGGPQAINAGDFLWSTAFRAVADRSQQAEVTLELVRLLSTWRWKSCRGKRLN